jgi:hypothetical protein
MLSWSDDRALVWAVMKSIIAKADTLLLASNIRRACNDKSAKDLLPLRMRKALLQSGWVGELAFIATQSDVFNRSELIENLRLADDTPALECALARNAFTKKELTRDFYKSLPAASLAARPPCAAWHQMPFAMPVFTVSAVSYEELDHGGGDGDVFTTRQQTELPALLSFLRYAALAHNRRALDAPPAGAASSSADAPKPIGATLLECLDARTAEATAAEANAAAAGQPSEPWTSLSTGALKARRNARRRLSCSWSSVRCTAAMGALCA